MVNSDSRVKHPALFIDFGPRPFKFLTYVGCLGVLLLTVGNVASWADSCSEEVIARNRTATVFIRAKKTLKNTGGIEYRTGTGFIVSPSGYILTNRHVIETDETVDQIEITGSIASREAVPSRLTVIARNEHDVALLKFADTSKAYVTVILGRPGEVKVGRELCSVSFPKDQESYFASGAMSSTSGDRGFWVTQMPSNPGDSGAPVFLASGEVVAIKVGGYEDLQNVNLLIPMNLAQDLVNSVPDLPTVAPASIDTATPGPIKPAPEAALEDGKTAATLKPYVGGVREVPIPSRHDSTSPLVVEAIFAPKKDINYYDKHFDVYIRNSGSSSLLLVALHYDSHTDIPHGDLMEGTAAYPNILYEITYEFGHEGRVPLVPPYKIPAGGMGAIRFHFIPSEEIDSLPHWFTVDLIDSQNRQERILDRDEGGPCCSNVKISP